MLVTITAAKMFKVVPCHPAESGAQVNILGHSTKRVPTLAADYTCEQQVMTDAELVIELDTLAELFGSVSMSKDNDGNRVITIENEYE